EENDLERRDHLAVARETEAVRAGAPDRDPARRDLQDFRQPAPDRAGVRGETRSFRNHDGVDVAKAGARVPRENGHLPEELRAVGPAPLLGSVRKMLAERPPAGRAEKRVRDRVEEDVAVGVPGEAP